MSDRIERIILRNLFYNEDFTRKVLPFIKSDFFTSHSEATLFGEINEFVLKYKNLPTKETILVELNKRKGGDCPLGLICFRRLHQTQHQVLLMAQVIRHGHLVEQLHIQSLYYRM